jgi:polyketide cyclase/dehydrase/lipid transport protein
VHGVEIAGSEQIPISATAEGVWRMIADVTRTREWSSDVIRSWWIPPSTGPVTGARFETINRLPVVRRWRSRSTVTEADPGRRFAFAVGADADDPNTVWSWDLDPSPQGVIVTLTYVMRREPWIVLVYYRLVGQRDRVRRSVRATLERLKSMAELERA